MNNAEKVEPLMTQMEQWSNLTNVLNYIQYDRYPQTYHSLSVNVVNKHKSNAQEKGDIVELDFIVMLEVLKEEYLDVHDGIQSEVVSTTRFDENSDLSKCIYSGQTEQNVTNPKQKKHFPYQTRDIH